MTHNVEFITSNGNADLLVVNAARVSFGKRKEALDEQDIKLINYLSKHGHNAPFRHPQITLHITCSDTVARQFFKHNVGGRFSFPDTVMSEVSGRYVEYNEFDVPLLRKQAANVKQGSSDELAGEKAQLIFKEALKKSKEFYQSLLSENVSKEQARMILPFATITQFWITGSLEYWKHFVELRKEAHAQKEIQEVALDVDEVMKKIAPYSWAAMFS